MLDMLDSAISEQRVPKLAQQESFFRGVEAANAAFSESLVKANEPLLASYAAKLLPPEMDEELYVLIGDKEALLSAEASAHDARVARILKRELDLRTREEKRCSSVVQGARSEEMARNRARMAELRALGAACKTRIASALSGSEGVQLSEGGGGVFNKDLLR